MGKPRLLVAVTPLGYVHARRALHARFDLVSAFSVQQGVSSLRDGDIDAILCSIHFDESRMFDFLHEARKIAPQMPIVCCRILHSPLSKQAIEGLVTTAKSVGCRGYVDYNDLQRNHGFPEADRRFCHAVLELLTPPEEKRTALLDSDARIAETRDPRSVS
jgi:hypothetical protein